MLKHDLHTYIIDHYSQYYDLPSHTAYVVCINLIHKWQDLQFKVDSERQIFEMLFMTILFALRVFARNLLRGSRRRNIFMCNLIICLCSGKMYSAKSLKTAYLTWQIFLQKLRWFLSLISESHWKITHPTVIFFGCITETWMQFYALFNGHYWCSYPLCGRCHICSTPGGYWCRSKHK